MKIDNVNIASGLRVILEEFDRALKKREDFELGFNIFALVSDTYYKENFHSEIIHTLLNPEGKHKEGRVFLDLFLDFLKIDKSNYKTDIKVCIEHPTQNQRRIDIFICSKSHAIIIENKINNAKDMDDQLVDYYNDCKNKNLTVDAILYLSRDGCKKPDKSTWKNCDSETKIAIEEKLRLLSAFDNEGEETIFHWLEKSMTKAKNWDAIFIIKQYQQLLKSLRGYIMETAALEKYYNWLTEAENKDKVGEINKWIEIHNHLVDYYPEKLKEEFKDYSSGLFVESDRLKFSNLAGSNYCLIVKFESNNKCDIWIEDFSAVSNRWAHDDKLRINDEFKKLFPMENNLWGYAKKDYDLISNFNELKNDVSKILSVFSDIIGKKGN